MFDKKYYLAYIFILPICFFYCPWGLSIAFNHCQRAVLDIVLHYSNKIDLTPPFKKTGNTEKICKVKFVYSYFHPIHYIVVMSAINFHILYFLCVFIVNHIYLIPCSEDRKVSLGNGKALPMITISPVWANICLNL